MKTLLNCSVREFGAVGDGVTMDTQAIQKALDACHAAGGGRVTIEGGRYLSSTIQIKSGVELHLASDGVLVASDRTADYPEIKSDIWNWQLAPRRNSRCFIYAEGASRIAITGRGMIECPGARVCELYNSTLWKYRRKEEHFPPRMVLLVCCTDVVLRDFTIKDAAAGWATWILGCRDVNVDNVTMDADLDLPNSDGLHINCCQDVTVSNCRIRTGDDALIIRAYTSVLKNPTPCERIAVTNCTLTSHSSGIRLAWANDGIMRNCVLSNITITDSMVGIAGVLPFPLDPANPKSDQGPDATLIERIYFNNIILNRIWGEPIKLAVAPGADITAIRDLSFSNIHSVSRLAPQFLGAEDCPLQNITIDNAVFTLSSLEDYPGRKSDTSGYGNLRKEPVIRYVENLLLQNVRVNC
jgi:hypothetical protein